MTSSARYHMGIDTGGTYTDAVVLDAVTHQVIASAKALTTRGDLAVGVIEAIDRVLAALDSPDAAKKIALVSVSTWATNPDATSVFIIVPAAAGGGTGSAPTAADIADAVWDEAQAGHTTAGTFGRYLDAQVANVEADTQDIRAGRRTAEFDEVRASS